MFEYEHASASQQREGRERTYHAVKFALWKYHNALDLRQNGDVAAHRLVQDIQAIMDTPWRRGETLGLSRSEQPTTAATLPQK